MPKHKKRFLTEDFQAEDLRNVLQEMNDIYRDAQSFQ
jgi:hypothetical protein